jgi:hypothetical protein
MPVEIPTNNMFLEQWHQWILKKVSDRYTRDKDRVFDAAQDVRYRLLSKNFIGRWFFKHLTEELVDLTQANRILGGTQLKFIGSIKPVSGDRSSPDSLWKIEDILKYAKFDYTRYFYTIQNHTINSDAVIRLLGYPEGSYSVLASLYRQGRIKPSEFTEHVCFESDDDEHIKGDGCKFHGSDGSKCTKKHFSRGFCSAHYKISRAVRCPTCEKGRLSLNSRGISLRADWSDPALAKQLSKLRWNDSQLQPFLRNWQHTNLVKETPAYIMRPVESDKLVGIDAGLLKYAAIVIEHEVINGFKRISRGDDMSLNVFNNGLSPEFGDSETIVLEHEEPDEFVVHQCVFKDNESLSKYSGVENKNDLLKLINMSHLSSDEIEAISVLELNEITVKDYALIKNKTPQSVNRIRATAISKLRDSVSGLSI